MVGSLTQILQWNLNFELHLNLNLNKTSTLLFILPKQNNTPIQEKMHGGMNATYIRLNLRSMEKF
jgi:hypothetical protein